MNEQTYANTAGYLFILIGLVLSFISALVPHFEAGYHLRLGVLSAGMLPYLVYGIAVPLQRSTLTTLVGLLISLVHAWLIYDQRISGNGDYSDGLIYLVPMGMALVAAPVAMQALKRSGGYRWPRNP